ncbi:MAG TPA: hypothetical protein VGQ89_03270 [Candidatus Limnocylindrales bacterium]|jgi:hypothetical protein|nr:hypothetical protein [Candidatus Limnocylindrales bacterium]
MTGAPDDPRPVIVVVDDDDQSRERLERCLSGRYGRSYRVLAEPSPPPPSSSSNRCAPRDSVKRVAAAVGEGSTVIRQVHEYGASQARRLAERPA